MSAADRLSVARSAFAICEGVNAAQKRDADDWMPKQEPVVHVPFLLDQLIALNGANA
ncbi:MAG: hypothetical protein AAF222_05040 [Pseudomonadota bacterium]